MKDEPLTYETDSILTTVKSNFQAEELKASPKVKANLTKAFRAKHQSPIVVTMNRGIPLWQVAASLLLLVSAIWWFRPFERQTIVQAEPEIKIEEKIITVTDTLIVEKTVEKTVEKIIEKPVIQYVEIPSTTKTTIQQKADGEEPIAWESFMENTIFKPNIDLETMIDSYYDTAMIENIDRQSRGQSMGNSDFPSFEYGIN